MNSSGVRPKGQRACRRVWYHRRWSCCCLQSTSCCIEVLAVQAQPQLPQAPTSARAHAQKTHRTSQGVLRREAAWPDRPVSPSGAGARRQGQRRHVGSGRRCCHRHGRGRGHWAPRQVRGWCQPLALSSVGLAERKAGGGRDLRARCRGQGHQQDKDEDGRGAHGGSLLGQKRSHVRRPFVFDAIKLWITWAVVFWPRPWEELARKKMSSALDNLTEEIREVALLVNSARTHRGA